ncbi:MAG: hypothetical protein ACE5PV_19060 [Candidatus Poribacteria bacterium]
MSRKMRLRKYFSIVHGIALLSQLTGLLRFGCSVAYITNFERLAMEKGMIQDARELVIDALEEKFGEVPEGVSGRLQEIQSREILRQLHRQAIRAFSLEEFKKSLG